MSSGDFTTWQLKDLAFISVSEAISSNRNMEELCGLLDCGKTSTGLILLRIKRQNSQYFAGISIPSAGQSKEFKERLVSIGSVSTSSVSNLISTVAKEVAVMRRIANAEPNSLCSRITEREGSGVLLACLPVPSYARSECFEGAGWFVAMFIFGLQVDTVKLTVQDVLEGFPIDSMTTAQFGNEFKEALESFAVLRNKEHSRQFNEFEFLSPMSTSGLAALVARLGL